MNAAPATSVDPFKRQFSRRFQVSLVVEGALVGLAGGGVVAAYRALLGGSERLMRSVTGRLAGMGVPGVLGWVAVVACLAVVVSLIIRLEPDSRGSGIPKTDAEVAGVCDMCWWRVILTKFTSGVLVATAGLSLGREGPSVQLGGMAGKAVSKGLRRERGEERLLVTCGAAAGMSAAFHAPLTGVLFAVEEIHREFSAPLVISAMTASAVADFVSSQVLGIEPILDLTFASDLPHANYGVVVLLGLFSGLVGVAHNWGMYRTQGLMAHLDGHGYLVRLAPAFACAAAAAFLFPELMCGGDAIIEELQAGRALALGTLAALFAGKYLFTNLCFSSDAPGGTLLPLVVLGCLWGAMFGVCSAQVFGLDEGYVVNFMALGIAALFSSVVKAPVTGVVLVFELTGSFDALLSLTLVSMVSFVTANMFHVEAFYEHGLAPLMGSERREAAREGHMVLRSFVVGAGSTIEGRLVREVPWPDGARIATIERAGASLAPTGGTTIEALDELEVLVLSELEEDCSFKLHAMCEATFE